MSTDNPCTNSTAPIDIQPTKATCDQICQYKYQYSLSNCILSNEGDYLQIQTTPNGNSIFLNNNLYNVKETRLYYPSLHTFNGTHAKAELIIHHTSDEKNFLVCIPVGISPASSPSSDFFSAFLKYTPQTEGNKVNVNVSNWSLNSVIPKGAYYFYQATAPYPPCAGVYNLIVFDYSVKATMSAAMAAYLTSGIKKNTYTTHKAASALYYNAGGTMAGDTEASDIYIDCQPVKVEGDDGTNDEDSADSSSAITLKTPPSLRDMINSPFFKVGVGLTLFLILKKIYNKFLKMIS